VTELVEYTKDGIILLAGGGVVIKSISMLISKLRGNQKTTQTVTVNAGNTNGNNGRVYATKQELSKHALDCAGKIHEKINENYTKLSEQVNDNHKESMQAFSNMRVSITKLESMKSK